MKTKVFHNIMEKCENEIFGKYKQNSIDRLDR